ncbi:hypothetical protein LCGC14_1582320 [marine sediment metagenome]|uniref:Uncharacterized protein n=1 Tax=marine sediment metagenome TaxID=412755 RepID=A0A0F9KX25_9ZZZZ
MAKTLTTDLIGLEVVLDTYPKTQLIGKHGRIRGTLVRDKEVRLVVEVEKYLHEVWLHEVVLT